MPRLPRADEEADLDPGLLLVPCLGVLDGTRAQPDPARKATAAPERGDEVVDEIGTVQVHGERSHSHDYRAVALGTADPIG